MTPGPAPLDDARTAAYLARLGVDRHAATPDLASLTLLHERHLRTIPFENLSIHLGEPIALRTDALVDKLTVRRRGGFCYELNGAFAALLSTLGFAVTLHEARVGPDGGGMPFDHLCLEVRGDGVHHLADVGFGASFLHPLRMDTAAPQQDPAGTYALRRADDGALDMVEDGTVQYRFTTAAHALDDFAGGCHYHQTSPESHFTQSTVCSMPTPDGRVTIAERTLTVTAGGMRSERVIDDDDELLALYRQHFGIALDRVPTAGAATAPTVAGAAPDGGAAPAGGLAVIGAGFGRTGTDSLRRALELLGFTRCYHMREVLANPEHAPAWQAAMEGRPVDWDALLVGYRATTDMPACLSYRELADHYPDAKVVLTVRDPQDWYDSARRTIFSPVTTTIGRTLALVDPRMRPVREMVRVLFQQVCGGWLPRRDHAVAAYERHVREVLATIPAERLLVYEVAQGWEPLCAFLGVPVPAQPFPHANSRRQFAERRWAVLRGRADDA